MKNISAVRFIWCFCSRNLFRNLLLLLFVVFCFCFLFFVVVVVVVCFVIELLGAMYQLCLVTLY